MGIRRRGRDLGEEDRKHDYRRGRGPTTSKYRYKYIHRWNPECLTRARSGEPKQEY
jgi:hypothetical protein